MVLRGPAYGVTAGRVDQTRWRMVPAGFRRTVASVTKRPVVAERFTVLPFRVEPPTRSVTVRRGLRAAVARETKRPVRALRETDRLRAVRRLLRGGITPMSFAHGEYRPFTKRLPAAPTPAVTVDRRAIHLDGRAFIERRLPAHRSADPVALIDGWLNRWRVSI